MKLTPVWGAGPELLATRLVEMMVVDYSLKPHPMGGGGGVWEFGKTNHGGKLGVGEGEERSKRRII